MTEYDLARQNAAVRPAPYGRALYAALCWLDGVKISASYPRQGTMIRTIACAASRKTKVNISEAVMLEALKRKGVPLRPVPGRPIYLQAKISLSWLKKADVRIRIGEPQYAGGPYLTRPNALRTPADVTARVSALHTRHAPP